MLLHSCVSVGVALYPQDGATAQALLNQADHKMYADKHRFYQRKTLAQG
ncbi:hypothetical protein PU634_04565 [Oceanimonas pelagia]|uniref:GGDEF domain-containing protein n=1 Tax=Oceanimonas pelagia TaxID=3028314 RepID=A0AA50KNU8_9GAMM|nr:hypothetical protein [Oceanimonas pelagia]WMC11641.1 hypothetical protein PU634_04565 [Oceanimonas pelagia]